MKTQNCNYSVNLYHKYFACVNLISKASHLDFKLWEKEPCRGSDQFIINQGIRSRLG